MSIAPEIRQQAMVNPWRNTRCVIPAWSAGIQADMDVSESILANLDAGNPCRHDQYSARFVGSCSALLLVFARGGGRLAHAMRERIPLWLRLRALGLLILLFLLAFSPVRAATPDLEDRTREIASELRCVVCQ